MRVDPKGDNTARSVFDVSGGIRFLLHFRDGVSTSGLTMLLVVIGVWYPTRINFGATQEEEEEEVPLHVIPRGQRLDLVQLAKWTLALCDHGVISPSPVLLTTLPVSWGEGCLLSLICTVAFNCFRFQLSFLFTPRGG